MKPTLLRVLLSSFLAVLPALSHAGDLAPRAEVNFRAGTDRSILMTEFWAPLAQQSDRVLYGDLRLMGDGDDNREGNLGFGYRQISPKTNSVLGGNIWVDRRRTENGNSFHQLTLGVESLGDTVDLRANGYIQLNGTKTRVTPNIGSATPYLSGTGIFYDTNGFIIEEPQDGFDAEVGYRLLILQKHIDATRVYAGGYHFWGDTTDNVTGFRIRTEAQVNSIFSVGARFQHDGPRGSQGFLEATLRFPFKSKKLFQEHGLKSRLDESPERDIDIVTGSKVDTGLMKPVLNASGTAQRILYVDNTNTNVGDGSKDNPFNTLASAQAALQENDILYINRGNGSTTGMDQGITIDKAGISLIGSGSALTYNGFTLLNAGLAPVITNTQTDGDDNTVLDGNGVLALADNISISGITVSSAQGRGILAYANNAQWNSFTMSNVVSTGSVSNGLQVYANDNASIQSVKILDSTSSGSTVTNGIVVLSALSSTINNVVIDNAETHNNIRDGVLVQTTGNSSFGNISLTNISTDNNRYGINVFANNGTIANALLSNVTANANTQYGVVTQVTGIGSVFENATLSNINISNTNNGILVQANTSGLFKNASLTNIISSNNSLMGINITAQGSGTINNISLDQVSSFNNTSNGLYITANNGTIGNTSISNTTTYSNGLHGMYMFTQNAGTFGSVTIDNSTSYANTSNGIFGYAAASGSFAQFTLRNSTVTNNGGTGIRMEALANSTFNDITISNVTSNGSTHGILLYANIGAINRATVSSVTTNNNTQYGLYFYSSTTASVLNNVSLSTSNATGNTLGGVYVRKTVAGATLNLDMGGGSFDSTGQNRVFGNVGNDLSIERAVISAANNWWNNGGAAPTRVTLTNGGSATYTPPLASDPRP